MSWVKEHIESYENNNYDAAGDIATPFDGMVDISKFEKVNLMPEEEEEEDGSTDD